jgi:hypothetical protein
MKALKQLAVKLAVCTTVGIISGSSLDLCPNVGGQWWRQLIGA